MGSTAFQFWKLLVTRLWIMKSIATSACPLTGSRGSRLRVRPLIGSSVRATPRIGPGFAVGIWDRRDLRVRNSAYSKPRTRISTEIMAVYEVLRRYGGAFCEALGMNTECVIDDDELGKLSRAAQAAAKAMAVAAKLPT